VFASCLFLNFALKDVVGSMFRLDPIRHNLDMRRNTTS
jgi:hypothetical protein